MGHDNGHIRKVDCHVIQVHGIGVFEMHSTSTTHTRPDARMPGMKYRWQTCFRDHLVEDICLPIIGIEFLQGGVKFEATHPEVLDEATRLACSHLPLCRGDTSERNDHIHGPSPT